ncbi:ABC transporter permease [Vibrio rumoiensis]|uniref:Transport permease protein n=1 Tax=Vibrio rumoiensis TaxID=76258 RepID=A0ABW7IUN3_9VIBR
MTHREIVGRYRGSIIGLAWSFLNPLLMLSVYTFVFSVVFNAKWGGNMNGGRGEFAIILFAGMIVFNIFAECINRAPTLMIVNVNYVKKVVFPLEIIPWVALGNALFHALVSVVILLAAQWIIMGSIPLTAFALPFIMVPFIAGLMGGCWLLAAAGVYMRDLGQMMGLVTTVLMFTSPLFFPISQLPASLQPYLALNPLAYFIEQTRNVVIFGELPVLQNYIVACALSLFVFILGFGFFQKTRKGFADVL